LFVTSACEVVQHEPKQVDASQLRLLGDVVIYFHDLFSLVVTRCRRTCDHEVVGSTIPLFSGGSGRGAKGHAPNWWQIVQPLWNCCRKLSEIRATRCLLWQVRFYKIQLRTPPVELTTLPQTS